MAKVAEDGSIEFLGRGSVCINSGGEKVFAEEVEEALKAHPAVFDAVVVGVPDDRWGQRVEEAKFRTIADDKQDDGIIQNDVIGMKRRGVFERDLLPGVLAGEITQW